MNEKINLVECTFVKRLGLSPEITLAMDQKYPWQRYYPKHGDTVPKHKYLLGPVATGFNYYTSDCIYYLWEKGLRGVHNFGYARETLVPGGTVYILTVNVEEYVEELLRLMI